MSPPMFMIGSEETMGRPEVSFQCETGQGMETAAGLGGKGQGVFSVPTYDQG